MNIFEKLEKSKLFSNRDNEFLKELISSAREELSAFCRSNVYELEIEGKTCGLIDVKRMFEKINSVLGEK